MSGLKNQNLISDIANYLEKITENNFKYSWGLQSNNVYKMDIFGKSNISEKLKNGDVDDAIKYSTISVNKSYPSKDSNQRTSIYPAPETKSPASTSQNATAPTSSTTATITSGSLPNCEDQTKINNLLYNSVKDGKNFETLKVDNKRLKKITSEKGLDGWLMPRFFYHYGVKGHHHLGDPHSLAIGNYTIEFDVNNGAEDRQMIEQWPLLGDPSLMIGGYSS